ncbi:MAG TPA: Stk1 family PASTA domain-containing Ser/Thr kinase [Candidatus Copromorpha excrementigallinarum]|uniref:non-specific serine/threonine protein kinase n=1 Tax=Candidatus Allocopromorpha excrementigallinarum TaxID=2840742 RepID=A0A9D1HZN1_9FIRM|nr:Stk1 family PASTA domain-containing Ser/Thr kinase [Candidatus Copromorpha excrementigallinarum]
MSNKVLAGRYELFERIGEGGMSVVYKAKDKLLNRFVAIKILKPEFINDHKFIDSFRRESQAAASLSHPNIVNIYDVGREGNIHYIVMELIEGRTLSDYIKEQGAMPYPKVIALSKQIAAALSFAHKNHIIHRDVKPHNVMITPNGTAKITDFGIAKAVNAATIVDNTDGIIGSVHYFSPEQARGGYVDEKSDIYSLGIVMYEMLTGRVPFDGDNPVNIALMHINGEMTPPSKLVAGVPPALEHIIMKCTDKYPVNRYASADELIEALNNLEFVGSVVGNSVLMGGEKNGPIAETDYDDGEDEYEEESGGKKDKKKKPPMDKKKKIIIIAAAAVAAILAGVIAAYATGLLGGQEIEAPDFTNMTVEEARDYISENELDLRIKEGDEVVSEEVEKGRIVSQDPEAGQMVREGGSITVNVSIGLGDGTVPNLVGEDREDAESLLEAAGFTLGSVTEEASDEAAGTILRQDPSSGSEAEKGSAVNIVVSDGSRAQASVPYLIGRTVSDARSALANAGLQLGEISYDYSNTYAEGEVMWQQYDANAQLDRGTSVRIRVSRGPEPTEAPQESPSEED